MVAGIGRCFDEEDVERLSYLSLRGEFGVGCCRKNGWQR